MIIIRDRIIISYSIKPLMFIYCIGMNNVGDMYSFANKYGHIDIIHSDTVFSPNVYLL